MTTYVTLSRVCNLAAHRGHKLLTRLDDIEIWFCQQLNALHLHGRKDRIQSIKKVAVAIKESLEKSSEEEARSLVEYAYKEAIKQKKLAHPNQIYDTAKRLFGMSWYAFTGALEWIMRAAKEVMLAVDGIPTLIKKLGPYEVYALLLDRHGDPPIAEAEFICPACNTPWDLTELTSGTTFACAECGNWFSFTLDGDVERTNPPPNTGTIHGVVVDVASGKGLVGTTLYFNKRPVATDEHGFFLYPHVPPGKYKVKVTNPVYETVNLEVEVRELRVYDLGSIRLVSRVPRHVALTATPAVIGGIVGGVATRDPLGAVAGTFIGFLIGVGLNILVDIASAAPPSAQVDCLLYG